MRRIFTSDIDEIESFDEKILPVWQAITNRAASSRSPTKASNCMAVSETISKVKFTANWVKIVAANELIAFSTHRLDNNHKEWPNDYDTMKGSVLLLNFHFLFSSFLVYDIQISTHKVKQMISKVRISGVGGRSTFGKG